MWVCCYVEQVVKQSTWPCSDAITVKPTFKDNEYNVIEVTFKGVDQVLQKSPKNSRLLQKNEKTLVVGAI